MRLAAAVATLAAMCTAAEGGQAQSDDCRRAPFKLMRYDEDYSYLRDSTCRSRASDQLKYVDLGREGAFVSLGGTIRQRYEKLHNMDWGRGAVDQDGYYLARYMVHADLHVDRWRLFTSVGSHQARGRNGGPRPTDADELDLHQVFVEVAFGAGEDRDHLRIGRQEIAFGSERLVSVRDGPNVRRSFDGVRAILTSRGWRADAFAAVPVRITRGVFDNRAQRTQTLWGVYATSPVAPSHFSLDVYYLGFASTRARFEQGMDRERRHSVGARGWGKAAGFDYDVELVEQWGSFGAGRISAWTVASNVGYTVIRWRGRPRFGLKADVTTGDDDPTDSQLTTFNPLFPRGGYFGLASLIGPLNHIDLHPSVDVVVAKGLLVSGDWDVFWRESMGDGQYNAFGALQVPANGNRERFVGSQASVTAVLRPSEYVGITANYGHFFTGPFVRQMGLSRGLDYFTLWLDLHI
jgi:Alginate export